MPELQDTNAAPGPDVLRAFRQFKNGLLVDEELRTKVRFVLDPRSGMLVLPLTGAPVSEALTLQVPDEMVESMQLLLEVSELDPSREDLCDRWRIYHGNPESTRWFVLRPDSVKWEGRVYDGSEITQPSIIGGAEGRLCKKANADRAKLGDMCRRLVRTVPAEPMVVGVDADGLDLRARFGIIRIEFETRASDVGQAERMLDAMLAGGAHPGSVAKTG